MFWPFKKYDVEMSPEVRGVIKLDGKPQVGLTVHRELFYEGYKKGKTLKDEAQTNELGEFFLSWRYCSVTSSRRHIWREFEGVSICLR